MPRCRLLRYRNYLELAAARAAAGDALVEYDEPVDLAGYDRAFELLEGGAASA